MFRDVLAILLALLLVGMQQEAQLHALTHVGDLLHRPHEQSLQTQVDDAACAECALLAGGSHAVPTNLATVRAGIARDERIFTSFSSHAVPAPSYYFSRAPPLLL